MKVEQIVELMYGCEKAQLICMEDIHENVLFIGSVRELRLNHPKSLEAEVKGMYTERYGAFSGEDGLTVIV